MIRLTPDSGIPRHILLMMAVLAGFTVSNLHYNQPLLEMICRETGITHVQANLITVITQIGYALGLLFVVPLADMVSLWKHWTLKLPLCSLMLTMPCT